MPGLPLKVERAALQNAASAAGLLLTTECMVPEIPEPKTDRPQGGPNYGMDM